MKEPSQYSNSGVHANVGMEFQKHCAILILLENFDSYKNKRFFIILEHHEDVVFAFLNKNSDLEIIDTYQAKKSSQQWTRSGLVEILYKMIKNASFIRSDNIRKSSGWSLNQYFTTNCNIELKTTKDKVDYFDRINETNPTVAYSDVQEPNKEYLSRKLITDYKAEESELEELKHTSFYYIDLNRKAKEQRHLLIGKIQELFEDKITYPKAAYSTLMQFLGESEKTYNLGGTPSLLDYDKRIESEDIFSAFNILTNKSKAFNLWRAKEDEFSKTLNIGVFQKKSFELNFQNSFDKFKDITEAEHQKVFTYVESKENDLVKLTSDKDCLKKLLSDSKYELNTKLLDIEFKATLCAAYIQFKEIKNEESLLR